MLTLLTAACGPLLACSESPLFEGGSTSALGGTAGAPPEEEPELSQTCAADIACTFPGVTLYSGVAIGVTLDPEPTNPPGGYEFVPGAPSVRVGLPGQALSTQVRVLFELEGGPPSPDIAVLFDSGDERGLLLSEVVQNTVMAELEVGGLVRLVRLVPDLPPGCAEKHRPGGQFDITELDDLLKVTHIEGDLTLSGPLPDQLATLSCLVSVEGDLTIAHTEGLMSLEGLEQLTIVGGKLQLEDNPDLVQADLPGLEGRVAGLTLTGNPELELFGAGDLIDVAGPLLLSENGQNARFLDLDLYFVRRVRGHTDIVNNVGWSMDRSLGSLETIEGRLTVRNNDTLETMDDLLALRSIGSSLEIGNNPALRSAFGFTFVTEVGGSVQIHDNPKLEFVNLGSVSNLPGDLAIAHNASASPALVIDLPALEVVHGLLDLSYNRNWDLELGLSSLNVVQGAATIRENDALTSLSELEALRRVEGDLTIDNNAALEQIELPVLTDVIGGIAVHSHPSLRRLALPEVRASAGSLVLAYNGDGTAALDLELPLLGEVHGNADVVHNAGAPLALDLGSLSLVEGHLNVFHDAGLIDLTSLSLLKTVLGALDISNNPALQRLHCDDLQAVDGNLRVHSNPNLTTATFPQLPEVAGDLYLAHNGAEASELELSLGNLEEIQGALTLEGNAHFGGSAGLELLERVGGSLIIHGNQALTQLPVVALRDIGGELRIEQNLGLESLGGLTGIDELGGTLTVLENPALPTCEAYALRGWLVTAGWVGAWNIDDNAHDACSP